MSAPPRLPEIGTARARSEAAAAASRLGEADTVLSGILDLAVGRPLALDALLSVSAVEWSAEIRTACVECVDRPRILLNPCFVKRFCGTRQRLALLVLHELSHISLGHTRLYPRPTAAHNLAFDALINAAILAGVARSGDDPEPYAALPAELYGAAESPWFILRPPPGWPDRPSWRASAGCPEGLREIHRRLYTAPPRGRSRLLDVTYGEVMAAIVSAGEAGTCVGPGRAEEMLRRLLGAHGVTEHERRATSSGRDANAGEALREVLGALRLDQALGGVGPGGEPYHLAIARRERERRLEHALSRLLRRVFVDDPSAAARWTSETVATISPDPTRDRRAATRRAAARMLGAPAPLLFSSEVTRVRPERRGALLYLDVSASMEGLLERLHASLVPLRRLLATEIYVFSTEVVPVTRAVFARGEVTTTGGTSVEPVLRHLASSRSSGGRDGAKRRALLLTDGYFDAPSAPAVEMLAAAGGELHLGVVGSGPLHDKSTWVASTTRLPDSLRPRTGVSR